MRQFFPSKRTYLGVTEPLSTALPAESDLESSNKLRKTLEPWTLVPRDVEAKRDHALQIVESIFLQFVRQTCQRKNLAESLCLEAGGRLETFGSHRLGVDHKDSDIDVVCVGPKFVTREDFFSGMLTVLKDCPLVSAAVAITDAYVPVINLVLNGIEIDLVYTRLLHSKVQKSLNLLDDSIIEHLDDRCIRSLNGLRVAERILNLVPDIATFKTVLQFIKVWAKQRGLYSNILGFLGGVSWAIAVARVCQLYPNSSPNIIATKFFSTLLHWDWNTPILLQKIKDTDPFYTMYTAKPHLMPIITPAYPCMATTHNVSSSSFQIIQQEFKRGTVMTEMVALGKAAWADVLDPTDAFFGKYKNYIQLIVSSDSQDLQFKWSGLVESKIRQLAIKLELQEGIQLVHPFAHSFRKKAPCQSVEEASNACLGIYPASNVGSAPYPEIMSVYTTTFYIGLELAVSPTASMSSRGLDLSLLIQGFVAIVKGWESFKEEHMCIVVNKMKRYMLNFFFGFDP
ncbi:Poly(A) polymerase central domain-containing protein [Obelidium mucronatum]|nr:Poly(A) polymerase central domain-containing protein [Obelidium mucronatum]